VDPFNDWCGRDSGPGEICASAACGDAAKPTNRRNTETPNDKGRTRLFQTQVGIPFSSID
jgi:hypothetical protein